MIISPTYLDNYDYLWYHYMRSKVVEPKGDIMKQLSQAILAQYVKDNRRIKGLTQELLCEKTGLNRATIGRIERMQFVPSIEQLEKLADVLSFDIASIFVEAKPTMYTAFRGKYVENEDAESVDHLFEMMLTARKQINIRKALSHEN